MVNVLKQYFPMIRTRGEVLKDISGNERLWELFPEMSACGNSI